MASVIFGCRDAFIFTIIIMKDANLCAGGHFHITHTIYAYLWIFILFCGFCFSFRLQETSPPRHKNYNFENSIRKSSKLNIDVLPRPPWTWAWWNYCGGTTQIYYDANMLLMQMNSRCSFKEHSPVHAWASWSRVTLLLCAHFWHGYILFKNCIKNLNKHGYTCGFRIKLLMLRLLNFSS